MIIDILLILKFSSYIFDHIIHNLKERFIMNHVTYQDTCKDYLYNNAREILDPSHPNYKEHQINLEYLVTIGIAFIDSKGIITCSFDIVSEFVKNNYKTKAEIREEGKIKREWLIVIISLISLVISMIAFFRSSPEPVKEHPSLILEVHNFYQRYRN